MVDCSLLGQALQHVLCAYRAEKGMSQQALADRSGLTRQYISYVETQKRIPGLITLIQLSEGFGITLEELCGEIERMMLHYSHHRPIKEMQPDEAADSGTVTWKTPARRPRK